MTPNHLYQLIIDKSKQLKKDIEFTEMQRAILEEMCEHVINSQTVDHSNEDLMILISLNSLDASYTLMKGLIMGLINTDNIININYRGRTFSFDKNTKSI